MLLQKPSMMRPENGPLNLAVIFTRADLKLSTTSSKTVAKEFHSLSEERKSMFVC